MCVCVCVMFQSLECDVTLTEKIDSDIADLVLLFKIEHVVIKVESLDGFDKRLTMIAAVTEGADDIVSW